MADEPVGNRRAGSHCGRIRTEVEFYFALRDLKWAARTFARRFLRLIGGMRKNVAGQEESNNAVHRRHAMNRPAGRLGLLRGRRPCDPLVVLWRPMRYEGRWTSKDSGPFASLCNAEAAGHFVFPGFREDTCGGNFRWIGGGIGSRRSHRRDGWTWPRHSSISTRWDLPYVDQYEEHTTRAKAAIKGEHRTTTDNNSTRDQPELCSFGLDTGVHKVEIEGNLSVH